MRRLFLATLVMLLAPPAFAYTDCAALQVDKLFSGDNGNVWIHFTNGGAGLLLSTNMDKQTQTAFAMTALAAQRTLTIRYAADNVPCTAWGRSDVLGLYLN